MSDNPKKTAHIQTRLLHNDRWAGVAHQPWRSGAPLLAGAAAVFECRNRSQYVEGDHTIFVGEVLHCTHQPHSSPLLYHGGMFYTEHPLGRVAESALY